MDSTYSYLAKKTNVKELNVEIQVKGRYPGYSLETAKRFDNKSIAYRNLGLNVTDKWTAISNLHYPFSRKCQ